MQGELATIDERTIQKELRRNQYTLIITGAGVIIFGVWSLVKTLLLMVFAPSYMHTYFNPEDIWSDKLVMTIIYIIVVLISIIGLLIQLYIGRSAIKEARGKRKRSLYLVIAVIEMFFLAVSILSTLFFLGSTEQYLLNSIVSMFIDFTLFVIFLELFISSRRLRKIRKQLEAQEADAT